MSWKPGQSGNPSGGGRTKPWLDALRMEAALAEKGEATPAPKGSLRWNARMLLESGEIQAIKEIGDRFDGKVPQAVVGDDEHDPIRTVTKIELVALTDGDNSTD